MRNVLVTGGSRGIGLAICQRLAREGFNVIAAARSESEGLREAIAAAPGKIHFKPVDLNVPDTLANFALEIRKQHGPVYGLVNNAGIGSAGLLGTMPDTQISELLRVNIEAPILLSKYVVRQMMSDGEGRIINMGSIIAHHGANALSVYAASKAALEGFSRSLAREVGKLGVTVNTIAPGYIATDINKDMGEDGIAKIAGRSALRRLPETQDIAAMVAYLLGDGGRNITGTVLTVDAGNTA